MSAASGGNSEPEAGQRSQSAKGFCPLKHDAGTATDIIEHFGNAQMPCRSRRMVLAVRRELCVLPKAHDHNEKQRSEQ